MQVAVGGPHSAGKTTFARGFAERIAATGAAVRLVHDVARLSPIPFTEATMLKAQRWVLEEQLRQEELFRRSDEACVYDGCSLAYLAYYQRCGGRIDDYAAAVRLSMQEMSRIFWLPAQERFLIDDGVRPTDPEFQRDIYERQKRLIGEFGLKVDFLELPFEDS